jgi:hypothetical protein
MHDMAYLNLVPKFESEMIDKCIICMQTKITIEHFPKIDRTSTMFQIVTCIVILRDGIKSIL